MIGNSAFANSLGGLEKRRIDYQHKIVNYVIVRLKIIKNKIIDHDFSNVINLTADTEILTVAKYNSPICSRVI